MPKINLFISYAHEDADYCNELKRCLHERFCPHLNVWDDGEIQLGAEWDGTIKKHLSEAHIILLLISRDFLLSDYIEKVELTTALEKHKQNKCRVIPIFTRNCILDNYTQITNLQGLPKGKFLAEMGKEIDAQYVQIQREINELAAAMLTDENIVSSIAANDDKSTRANVIENLRNLRRIFLSVPQTKEAREKRRDLIIQADAKAKYEDWPYEIVPGLRDMQRVDAMSEEEQKAFFSDLLTESVYSIHIVAEENDLSEGINKLQYELASKFYTDPDKAMFRNIIWFLSGDLLSKVDKRLCENPAITGNDYGALFEKIASLDVDKEKEIVERKKEFYPNKKVYLYYLFPTDHDNDLRIDLKTKIEEKNFSVRWNTPGEDLQKLRDDLAACEGAVIFYGAAGTEWFNVGQARLLDIKNLRSRGVCLDEPEMEKKARRDVSTREFITIRGQKNLDAGLTTFLEKLQS
ncbi:MAG TPA: toll/interleukin-1 receptor domain-containing protein [Flavisolibacter sp.]|jgi:hypothetical protein|nr:toll/interleukin-1 receptor domain-containing protein [Flavisolibacter sp.]